MQSVVNYCISSFTQSHDHTSQPQTISLYAVSWVPNGIDLQKDGRG